ncbi:GntR family transcriptional regulator [Marinomonas sp. M1K-6]|uniref:GntR family transcriptional regulator n=1 Tax=Marinomonas profundi TaxID=2726122 RepID=A0A847R5K3_9GAMM|nr:GntR family transcriptional regulator [Marinomonas profundi]NLQ17346.1 GntR family transcriptional regulator [Marinomonas profundi]UDV01874.1 GntR family transcriptional regulator [Marinomonas profundi]
MTDKAPQPSPIFKPLYKQVQELITERIIEGIWKPGEMLPSEFQLADLLGVSQGTVRKALNALTEDNVLFRRQGVGTFVSEHTLQKMLFHFFHFKSDNGDIPELPNAQLLEIRLITPDTHLRALFGNSSNEKVIEIHRVRSINNTACIRELIYLPQGYFVDLEKEEKLPHSLYHYYQQRFNITVHKATDRLKAVLANEQDQAILNIASGQPLLEVSRTARSLDGRTVEHRISRANSQDLHYLVELN